MKKKEKKLICGVYFLYRKSQEIVAILIYYILYAKLKIEKF